jgi:adenylate cyclase
LLPQVTAVTAAICAIMLLAATGWMSWHEFTANGILLDPAVPGLTTVLTYSASVVWLYRDEQRRRREVREAFGRYLSPAVVAQLADDPSRLVLGGEVRTLTVMFCDVRGFTALAERLDARGLTQFMNEYLSAMTDALLANGGTVDKYIGDAVMAFWNAPLDDPDHARHGARAALAMVDALAKINERRRTAAGERDEACAEIKFGIGLATGDCSVGNFGSIHRFDYSAMGDQVNLAARLEGATKFYQTDVLASQSTRDLAPDLAWLEVDAVRVKGKSEVARVHTLAGDESMRRSPAFAKLASAHEQMLAAYRSGEFLSAALSAGQAAAVASPRLLGFYAAYAERCRLLAQSVPGQWQPITELQEK